MTGDLGEPLRVSCARAPGAATFAEYATMATPAGEIGVKMRAISVHDIAFERPRRPD